MGTVYFNQHHAYIDDELQIELEKEQLRGNDDFLCFSQELYDEENKSLSLEWVGKYPAPKSLPIELDLELIGKLAPDQMLIIHNNQQEGKPLSVLSMLLTHPVSILWLKTELEKELQIDNASLPSQQTTPPTQTTQQPNPQDTIKEKQSFLQTWGKQSKEVKEQTEVVDIPTRPKLITPIPVQQALTPEKAQQKLFQTLQSAQQTHVISRAEILHYLEKSNLDWDDLRKGGVFNHDLHLALSLTNPVTQIKTAEKVYQAEKIQEVLTLEQASQLLEPGVCVVISDVHGNIELLQNTLQRLNITDSNNVRTNPEYKLVSVGDLIDGREATDFNTLEFGDQIFDHIICGNHEAAFLGGPTFDMQREVPELTHGLRRMLWTQRLDAAIEEQGVLISHAGYNHTNPQQAAQKIQEEWLNHCQREDPTNKLLFAIDRFRGGMSHKGGVMWESWKNKVIESQGVQIVGHTPLGESEKTKNSYNIDLTGNRLGIAIIKQGQIIIASSLAITE